MCVHLGFSRQGTWPHWTFSTLGEEVAALCFHSRPEPVFLTHSDPSARERVHRTQPGSKQRPLLSLAWESQVTWLEGGSSLLERRPVGGLAPQSRPGARRVTINWHKLCASVAGKPLCALIQVSQPPYEPGDSVYPYFIDEEPETRGG